MYAPTLSPLKHSLHPFFNSPSIRSKKKRLHRRRGSKKVRTNSSKTLFEESVTNFKTHLLKRGYPENFIKTTLSEVTFEDRNQAFRQKQNREILPFVTQYHPAVPYVKPILTKSWHFIISYKRGRSLKEILVRGNL